MGGLDASGQVVHVTHRYGYPLPPPIPGKYRPVFSRGRYRLPDPESGQTRSFTRASTIAKEIEDTRLLEAWQRRQMLIGLSRSTALAATLDQTVMEARDQSEPEDFLRASLNSLAEDCQLAAGTEMAAEFGTCVHAWTEAVDIGLVHPSRVPRIVRPWVEHYLERMAAAGLIALPEYRERIVLNSRFRVAGTLDAIYLCPDGQLRLGDVKTSRTMDYSWLYFCTQLAIYLGADYMLSRDGSRWEEMPQLDADVALVAHIPREHPENTAIVALNMVFGEVAMKAALHAREVRKQAGRKARSVPYDVQEMTPEQLLRSTARHRVITARTEAELAEIWEQYQLVWTDELTALGLRSVRLANEKDHA